MSNDLLQLFKKRGALMEGHFLLSSGLHSHQYMQSAILLQDPKIATELGRSLADLFPESIDAVISPAIGGLLIGNEVARAKNCRFLFTEKDDKGRAVLRRGFEIQPDERLIIIEDVITTGLSSKEVMNVIYHQDGKLIGIGCLVNRSGMNTIPALGSDWQGSVRQLLPHSIETWTQANCPLCKKGSPAVKPGSRKR